ncbi:hydrogenase nickel incorporation protein HypB [Goodfellowiella coeruleoviolacea]|uniref:Hydrogenase nickel incorporation protein HypB n=1 Tax=Goodfellowiella coeruleoviolacea TaxID=334858 RepID=A0AAE3G8G5_9PSEU|nr:hydrogenase nickel incorporation protein HypB [Goodfellowiella coeruleoviolacea]MCP2163495.1 hydrogenase nickel incorporation protein HypB [Goodfellowiella coeruleoviolacea]
MCGTCGCSEGSGARIWRSDQPHDDHHHHGDHDHGGDHNHGGEHDHPHEHDHGEHHHGDQPPAQDGRVVRIEHDVLAKNNALAERNRRELADRGIVAVNVMSSPGAGKTTLLERTIRALAGQLPLAVVEGDQETRLDAERIRATGAPVVQINTGAGCHLDAELLASGVRALDPPEGALLFVENVGNLVCPALFDLGERHRVVVTSVTEGADKPLKYPHMFAGADLVLLNKIDLLPHVEFDVDAFLRDTRTANPHVEVIALSASTGDGLDIWYRWLRSTRTSAARSPGRAHPVGSLTGEVNTG